MADNINNSFLEDLFHDGDLLNSEKGDLKIISGKANLRQAIIHRLITSKGSIVHRPNYGVGIKSYQGAIYTLDKQRELALKIREQLELDDRIESVDSVKFENIDQQAQGTFSVKVKITAISIGQTEESINPFDKDY